MLDYHVLGERVDDEGNKVRRVLLVVAYRELVDRYVAACKKAGIRLAGIDLEAFALLRALGEPHAGRWRPSDAALVVVSVGHDRSTFAVSDGRACEFTRVLDWGGSTLDVAIARALDCAPSEAEPIKRELSLDDGERPEGLDPGAGRPRARSGPTAAPVLRTRARLLAPVLPEPARLSGHRRDRDHRRHRAPRRARGGAPAADRRARRGRRPAHAGEARQEGSRDASSSARSQSQSASGSRTDVRAINLLPRDDVRRGGPPKIAVDRAGPRRRCRGAHDRAPCRRCSSRRAARPRTSRPSCRRCRTRCTRSRPPTPRSCRARTRSPRQAGEGDRAQRGAHAAGRLGSGLP